MRRLTVYSKTRDSQREGAPMVRSSENQAPNTDATEKPTSKGPHLGPEDLAALNRTILQGLKIPLLESEKELLLELIHALRTIRFGSIVLTVHEGQLVEINKSIRIRRSRPAPKDHSDSNS